MILAVGAPSLSRRVGARVRRKVKRSRARARSLQPNLRLRHGAAVGLFYLAGRCIERARARCRSFNVNRLCANEATAAAANWLLAPIKKREYRRQRRRIGQASKQAGKRASEQASKRADERASRRASKRAQACKMRKSGEQANSQMFAQTS